MPKISIHRQKSFIGFARPFRVFVDGEKIGTISNDSTAEFEIPAGSHKLYCNQDVFNTPFMYNFTIAANDTKSFTAAYERPVLFWAVLFVGAIIGSILSHYFTSLLGLNYHTWLVFYAAFLFVLVILMKLAKMFTIKIWEN